MNGLCLIYLIKKKKKKAHIGKEIIKITFTLKVPIITISSTAECVEDMKGLNMIDVIDVDQIKIAYTEKYKPLKR